MARLIVTITVACLVLSMTWVRAADCARTSVGLAPLIDGAGLYPDGSNNPPPNHVARGQQVALELKARTNNVLLSVGMSNTNQKFERFRRDESTRTDHAANLTIVNGASGHQSAEDWANYFDDAYTIAAQRLSAENKTPFDVGVIWAQFTESATADRAAWQQKVLADSRKALETLMQRYPNAYIFYLAARTYGGYESIPRSGIGLNPEPYAHDSGALMKTLVIEHLAGTLQPEEWIAWGPYFWADGLTPRSDGLTWACSDFQSDGVHPSDSGARKAATLLSGFFRSDPVARIWFLE